MVRKSSRNNWQNKIFIVVFAIAFIVVIQPFMIIDGPSGDFKIHGPFGGVSLDTGNPVTWIVIVGGSCTSMSDCTGSNAPDPFCANPLECDPEYSTTRCVNDRCMYAVALEEDCYCDRDCGADCEVITDCQDKLGFTRSCVACMCEYEEWTEGEWAAFFESITIKK